MKMVMRLDKTQVAPIKKITATGSFYRDLAIMAGYTNYEALLVGGAGGKSGDARGNSANTHIQRSCGGGGGGSLALEGLLEDLPAGILPVVIGGAGANGADSAVEAKAGNGGGGGHTTFAGHQANGGGGAVGGDWNVSGFNASLTTNSDTGNGGSNSAALGAGGVGGTVTNPEMSEGFLTLGSGNTAPTVGTFVAGGSYPVVGGGRGGGGGPGDVMIGGASNADTQSKAGSTGSSGAGYSSGGGAAGATDGGDGGGADIFNITGAHEYYGGGAAPKLRTGVVAIKLS